MVLKKTVLVRTDYKMLFLRQSYLDATEEYEKILNTNQIGNAGVKTWDYVVLTASDSRQAAAFQAQINCRLAESRLPVKTKYLVVPDRDDKRVGSGGASQDCRNRGCARFVRFTYFVYTFGRGQQTHSAIFRVRKDFFACSARVAKRT